MENRNRSDGVPWMVDVAPYGHQVFEASLSLWDSRNQMNSGRDRKCGLCARTPRGGGGVRFAFQHNPVMRKVPAVGWVMRAFLPKALPHCKSRSPCIITLNNFKLGVVSRVWRYSPPPGGTHFCTLVCQPKTNNVCEPPMFRSSTAVPARASPQTAHSSTRHRATLDRRRSHPPLIVPHRRCRIGS